MRIVQISDTHLYGDTDKELLGVNTFESFSAVLKMIAAEPILPDYIVLSGDLSQDESEASYNSLVKLLKPFKMPIYAFPGNHDDLGLMKKVLPQNNISTEKNLVFGNWNIIFLNSQIPGRVIGRLSHEELQYMDDTLIKFKDYNSIVMFHHHPVPVNVGWLDRIGLQNSDEFWSIATNHVNLKHVFFGHVHQEYQDKVENIKCFSTPSTSVQFKGKCQDFSLENIPQGFRYIDLNSNGTLQTAVQRIDRYIGKFDPTAKGYK